MFYYVLVVSIALVLCCAIMAYVYVARRKIDSTSHMFREVCGVVTCYIELKYKQSPVLINV